MTNNTIAFTPRNILPAGSLVTLCTQFLKGLQGMGYAQSTFNAYRCDLEQFVGFAASRDVRLAMHINAALVEDWILAITLGEGWKHRTAARKLETLKSFIKFAIRRKAISFNPVEGIEVKFDSQRVIAPPESKLLNVIEQIPDSGIQNIRDRALLRLLYDSGLRISGLLTLDCYDDMRAPQYCVHPSGVVFYRAKGGKVKRTVIDDTTLDYLQKWFEVRSRYVNHRKPLADQQALCLSQRGTRLTREALHSRIKIHGKRAGMPDLHAHLFRHRRLGDIYEQTGDMRLAADMGGHESMKTFADIYGHCSGEVQRHRIRRDAPLGRATETAAANTVKRAGVFSA